MSRATSEPDIATTDLAREALVDARELLRIEIALAKDELFEDLGQLRRAAILSLVTGIAALLALAMLLVAFAMYLGAAGALGLAGGLVVVAGACGMAAFVWLPKSPLEKTRSRLSAETELIREHLA